MGSVSFQNKYAYKYKDKKNPCNLERLQGNTPSGR